MPRPRVVLPGRVVGACAQLVAEVLERRACHVADTWQIDVVAVELPAHLVWVWAWGWYGDGTWMGMGVGVRVGIGMGMVRVWV